MIENIYKYKMNIYKFSPYSLSQPFKPIHELKLSCCLVAGSGLGPAAVPGNLYLGKVPVQCTRSSTWNSLPVPAPWSEKAKTSALQ